MKKIITLITLYEFILECLQPEGWSWGTSYPVNFFYLWKKLGREYPWLNPQICESSPFNKYLYYVKKEELEKYKDEFNRSLILEWHIIGKISRIANLDGEE